MFMRSNSCCLFVLFLSLWLTACAGGPPPLPYPAFIDSNELPDAFIAALPGVRAKPLTANPDSRRSSLRVDLPADWVFTTGAMPSHSIELYVLQGSIQLGEFALTAGGYAYIPAASGGVNLASREGAQILYFTDVANSASVIQTPLITNSELLVWDVSATGLEERELLNDPGSGKRTWLQRWSADDRFRWQQSSVIREGYLIDGALQYAECSGGEAVIEQYQPGGYFLRPAGAVHGGPEVEVLSDAVWLMRQMSNGSVEYGVVCEATETIERKR